MNAAFFLNSKIACFAGEGLENQDFFFHTEIE